MKKMSPKKAMMGKKMMMLEKDMMMKPAKGMGSKMMVKKAKKGKKK